MIDIIYVYRINKVQSLVPGIGKMRSSPFLIKSKFHKINVLALSVLSIRGY